LSAGLSHELNNPAAAISRAAAQLRGALMEQHRLSVCLRAAPEAAERVAAAGADLAARAGSTAGLSGLGRADAEEAVADWLEARGVDTAWDAAPALAEAGADPAWLDEHLGTIAPHDLPAVVAVLVSAATTSQLTLEIEQASARISTLVSSVKTYTNMDGAGLQDVDIRIGLTSTLTMLAHKLKPYTVTTDWPDSLPSVPGNPGELNQVWTNLLDNAADALREQDAGSIAVQASAADDKVVVRISDNGPGMSPEVADKIFDPFFTTKPVGSGTGMGLDFVWKIVTDAHHGRISVETAPGEGTAFVVELPRTALAAQAESAAT
jgi:signal transduction histidine kinase